MKIQIRKIRPEGLVIEEKFSAEWTGLTKRDDARFVKPLFVTARVNRADDELIVKACAQSRYESFCYRCLDDIADDWQSEFTLIIDIEKGMEFIDLDEEIRQELILNLPARILCQEDCKGLCIDCGINLNKQECKHMHFVVSN